MVALKTAPKYPQKERFSATRTANAGPVSVFFTPQNSARYPNPQTGLWLSTDPAMGEYVPQAPVNDDAKKANRNLPGMGGVFNVVNLHVYHYAGNNPVKYTDPDGRKGSFPDGSAEQDALWNQNKGISNKYESLSLTESEKNMLIAAVFSESSPNGYCTNQEIAGITAVILNRTLEKFRGNETVSDTITDPGQVNGIRSIEYRYAMSKLDSNYSLSDSDNAKLTATAKMLMDRKLEVVTNIVNRVLSGSTPDPTRVLGEGHGALYWGSRDDYSKAGGVFRLARDGKMGTVLYEGSNPYGTYFFRGN
jgi:hypothetical protein